jgi:hypothetical protein
MFTPTQLQMAAKASDKSIGHRTMTEGRATFQNLAQAGKTILPNRMPNSGTPERIMGLVAAEAALGALVHPMAAAIGAAPFVAVRALMQAGPERQATAGAVRQLGPSAARAALAQALTQNPQQ